MPSKIVGKLITVSHPEFTIDQKKFAGRRQKSLNEVHNPTIIGHASGCEHLFKAKNGKSCIRIFKIFKGAIATKKKDSKVEKTEIFV